jgi:hypothetical protein
LGRWARIVPSSSAAAALQPRPLGRALRTAAGPSGAPASPVRKRSTPSAGVPPGMTWSQPEASGARALRSRQLPLRLTAARTRYVATSAGGCSHRLGRPVIAPLMWLRGAASAPRAPNIAFGPYPSGRAAPCPAGTAPDPRARAPRPELRGIPKCLGGPDRQTHRCPALAAPRRSALPLSPFLGCTRRLPARPEGGIHHQAFSTPHSCAPHHMRAHGARHTHSAGQSQSACRERVKGACGTILDAPSRGEGLPASLPARNHPVDAESKWALGRLTKRSVPAARLAAAASPSHCSPRTQLRLGPHHRCHQTIVAPPLLSPFLPAESLKRRAALCVVRAGACSALVSLLLRNPCRKGLPAPRQQWRCWDALALPKARSRPHMPLSEPLGLSPPSGPPSFEHTAPAPYAHLPWGSLSTSVLFSPSLRLSPLQHLPSWARFHLSLRRLPPIPSSTFRLSRRKGTCGLEVVPCGGSPRFLPPASTFGPPAVTGTVCRGAVASHPGPCLPAPSPPPGRAQRAEANCHA